MALILIAAYFLPAFCAWFRGHNNQFPIFLLDLLLGWTFFGWVIALVWAFTDNVRPRYPQMLDGTSPQGSANLLPPPPQL